MAEYLASKVNYHMCKSMIPEPAMTGRWSLSGKGIVDGLRMTINPPKVLNQVSGLQVGKKMYQIPYDITLMPRSI